MKHDPPVNNVFKVGTMKTYGYCDYHPECRLWGGGGLIANNSMDDKGHANPLFGWMCSHKDCLRVWEQELGYFTQKVGERIVYDGTGPRCSSHNCFMVIGDAATVRRYVCPVGECDEVGPVVDTPRQDCGTQKDLPGPAETKPQREMRIFEQFARAANLAFENARNCKEPYPDITYTVAREKKYIELGEITDETLAERRALLLKGNTCGGFTYSQAVPFLKMVCDKASKSYTTEGEGVDLLLYYEKQPPSKTALAQFLHKYTTEIDKLKRPMGPFSDVLIFDTWSNTVLWKTTA